MIVDLKLDFIDRIEILFDLDLLFIMVCILLVLLSTYKLRVGIYLCIFHKNHIILANSLLNVVNIVSPVDLAYSFIFLLHFSSNRFIHTLKLTQNFISLNSTFLYFNSIIHLFLLVRIHQLLLLKFIDLF